MSNHLSQEQKKQAERAGIRFYSSPEEKEMAYLREGLARTDKERLHYLLYLMHLQKQMQRAKFQ